MMTPTGRPPVGTVAFDRFVDGHRSGNIGPTTDFEGRQSQDEQIERGHTFEAPAGREASDHFVELHTVIGHSLDEESNQGLGWHDEIVEDLARIDAFGLCLVQSRQGPFPGQGSPVVAGIVRRHVRLG